MTKRSRVRALAVLVGLALATWWPVAGAQEGSAAAPPMRADRPAQAKTPDAGQQQAPGQPKQQSEPPIEGGIIRVSSNLVTVPVSVLAANGQPVVNLKASDFRLEEDGRQRPIVSLGEPGKTALDLALLIDVSGSVHQKFEFEKEAAAAFLREIWKPSDTLTVFSVGVQPRLLQPRTRSLAAAIGAVKSLEPTRDSTALFDAIGEAVSYLTLGGVPGTRRVLLVISDGEDNNSQRFRLADALRSLQHTDCVFYSINPSGSSIRLNSISLRGQNAMERLAAETGEAFLPASEADLQRVFRQIAAELQAQYLLGFYSGEERYDGGFHRIAVSLPAHPDLRVRARRGYYAPRG